jgi:4-hydroxybenzoate polyprenyltransferase
LPLVGTLLNVTNFAPLLWLGLSATEPPSSLVLMTALFSFLLLQNQLVHEAADRVEDARGGVATTFLVLGRVATAAVAAMLGAAAAGTCVAATPLELALVPTAITFSVALPLAILVMGDHPQSMARLRIVHRHACLVAGAGFFALLRWDEAAVRAVLGAA